MYRLGKIKNFVSLLQLASLNQHNYFYKFRHIESWIVNEKRTVHGD